MKAELRLLAVVFALVVGAAVSAEGAGADVAGEQMKRGEKIYAEKCAMCHQPSGQGTPPAFPPLAKSDWLAANRGGAIRALCEGLSGKIKVGGREYQNAMPAQVLDDAQAADVLTFVANSWGNEAAPFTAVEVKAARAQSRFKTFAALVKATEYQPLPKAPAGFALREVAQLPEFCTRLAGGGGQGKVYVLAQNGNVFSLDPQSGVLAPIINASEYLDASRGDSLTLGIALDRAGRLWITSNQKLTKGVSVYTNEVTIWRFAPAARAVDARGADERAQERTPDAPERVPPSGRASEMIGSELAKPKAWFRTSYPHGVGGFNHGVSHLAFGPDGMLYVSSGSRTDGGEGSADPHYFSGGEVDTTACIWRLDPNAEKPELEIFASGIRNAYGFAWNARGELFSFSNGPDFSAPEEMDFIEKGKHYGFPFQFSDWPVNPGFPYKHTPPAPAGIAFTPPVMNLGPAAGGVPQGLGTFDAHSSPAGAIWCGAEFPALVRDGFLVTRFGNLLGAPAAPEDVGFDLLSVRVAKNEDGRCTARVETILAPLARPIDVLALGGGRVLLLEYTRPTNLKDKLGWLPGRILELAPVAK